MKIGLFRGELNKIENFLKMKEDIELVFSARKVVNIEEELKTNIYELDKIIFIDTHTEMEMKEDLIALKEIIGSKNFFKVKKIEFITLNTNKTNISFIEYIMKDIDVDFKINIESQYSFSNLYNYILGKYKVAREKNNTYIDIYLRRKGDRDSLEALEPEKTSTTFKSLSEEIRDYEKLKMKIFNTLPEERLDRGVTADLTVLLDDKEFPDVDILDFEPVGESENDLTILTGLKSTGKTTIALALATSLLNLNEKVIIMDLSNNRSTTNFVESFELEVNKLNLDEMSSLKEYYSWVENISEDGINLVSYNEGSLSEGALKFYVNHILAVDTFVYGANIILDVPLTYAEVYTNLFRNANRIIFNSTARKVDLDKLYLEMEARSAYILKSKEKILLINSVYNENIESPQYPYEKILDKFKEYSNIRVTSKLSLSGYSVSGMLAKELLGGVSIAKGKSSDSN